MLDETVELSKYLIDLDIESQLQRDIAVFQVPQWVDHQDIQVKEYHEPNQKLVLEINQLTIVSNVGLSSEIHCVQTSQTGQVDLLIN